MAIREDNPVSGKRTVSSSKRTVGSRKRKDGSGEGEGIGRGQRDDVVSPRAPVGSRGKAENQERIGLQAKGKGERVVNADDHYARDASFV